MHVARNCIHNTRVGRIGRTDAEAWRYLQSRVPVHVCGDRNLLLVIVQSEPSAEHDPLMVKSRAPRDSSLRAEVLFLWLPQVPALSNGHLAQRCGGRAKPDGEHVVFLRSQRPKVAVTEAQVEGQVLLDLPVILYESTPQILAIILPSGRGDAGVRIECSRLRLRRVVGNPIC